MDDVVSEIREIRGLLRLIDDQVNLQGMKLQIAEPNTTEADKKVEEGNEKIQEVYDKSWRWCSLL